MRTIPPITRREWLVLPAAAAAARAQVDVHSEIREAAAGAPLTMRFRGSSARDALEWRTAFRNRLSELLGPHRPPTRWSVEIEDHAEYSEYRRESVLFRAPGHPTLPVHLLYPKRPNGAGIVALHGHGPFGHDAVAGIDDTRERRADIEKFRYDYGRRLARRGYTVACPCFQPFGRRLDRRPDGEDAYSGDDACAVSFVRMQLLGKVLMAENLRDALWAFRWVRGEENVDPRRIGCVGLSYGGRMTMLTAAIEPRIRAAVPSGALNVMQERIEGRYSCGAQVIPGLLEYGDVPEIAGLIAPRPALWEVGNQDGLMVKERIGPAWQRIERVYRAWGAGDRLEMDRFDGPHRWNGERAYPFLDRVLAG